MFGSEAVGKQRASRASSTLAFSLFICDLSLLRLNIEILDFSWHERCQETRKSVFHTDSNFEDYGPTSMESWAGDGCVRVRCIGAGRIACAVLSLSFAFSSSRLIKVAFSNKVEFSNYNLFDVPD